MKIKLTNYPYQEFKVGDICDFGEAKNRSLVAMRRAVYLDNPPLILVKKPDILIPDRPEAPTPPAEESTDHPEPKKLIKNELKAKVSQKTTKETPGKKSFWDSLK